MGKWLCWHIILQSNVSQLFLHYFNLIQLLVYHKATLVVAINEIKKSAKIQELSFYEYGTYLCIALSVIYCG